MRHFTYKGEIVSTERDPDVQAMIAADRLYLETIGALIRTREVRGEETNVEFTLRAESASNPAFARGLIAFIATALPPAEFRATLASVLPPGEILDASHAVEVTSCLPAMRFS